MTCTRMPRGIAVLFLSAFLTEGAETGIERRLWPGREQIVPIGLSPDSQFLVSVSGARGAMFLTSERPGQAPSRFLRSTHDSILAVLVRPGNQVFFTTAGPKGAALHSVGMDGAGETILASFPEFSAVSIADLSPDGKTLAALVWTTGPPQIALLSLGDRTARLLFRTSEWLLAGRILLFSPDGRYLVACRRMERAPGTWEGRRRQIIRIDVRTGAVEPLLNESEDVYPIGWTPDRSGLVFARDRFDSIDLVLQPMKNGVAAGPPRTLRVGMGRMSPVVVTKTGSFLYYSTPLKADVYLGDLDLNRGTLTNARLATTSSPGNHRWPFWSRDGQYLVLSSRRREGNPSHLFNRLSIVRPHGEVRDLPPLADTEGGFTSWRPDGSLLIIGNRAGQLRMHGLSPPSWSPLPLGILTVREHDLGYPVFGPDGAMYYRTDNPEVIVVRAPNGGEEKTVVRLAAKTYARAMRLSPDGKQLTFILVDDVNSNGRWQAIVTVGVDGRGLRELFRVDAPERMQVMGQGLAWSSDSRSILFTRGKNSEYGLFQLPAAGGEARQIQVDVLGESRIRATYQWMDASPDGKTLAFGHGADLEPELWIVDGLLRPDRE